MFEQSVTDVRHFAPRKSCSIAQSACFTCKASITVLEKRQTHFPLVRMVALIQRQLRSLRLVDLCSNQSLTAMPKRTNPLAWTNHAGIMPGHL